MTKQKQTANKTTTLPKTLWGFYFKHAIHGNGWMILAGAILSFIVAFDRVLQPLIQSWTVAIFETPVPAGMTLMEHALPTVLMIIGLNLTMTVLGQIRGWLGTHWAPRAYRQISEVLTAYVHRQSMSFWTGRMAGQTSSQMGQISTGFDVLGTLIDAFCRLATIVVNATLLFSVNRYVAYMFFAIIVFRVLYSWRLSKKLKDATKHRATVISKLQGKVLDSVSNYSLVKLFARSKQEEEHLAPIRTERVQATINTGFLQRLFNGVPAVLWDITTGINILLCVYLYSKGELTIAGAVLATSIYIGVFGTIAAVIDMLPTIIEKTGAAARAYEELVSPIDVMDAPNAPDMQVTCGTIEFRNVSFKYKRKWVLKDLNLKIKCGERVGIVGPSGAGKTTLVHLLMRFWDPTHGQILIDGQDIKEYTQDSLRENIAFIPQDPTMFNRTLRENIGYGKVNATDAEIRRAAKRAAAHDFIMETDKKYDSLVGDRGIKLSGGQRQRIAIARAFLKDAPILVLDEATSALDSETEVAIQESFEELATGRTTVAIAHRLSTLRNMDRIIVIKDCHVIEQGSHQSLLRKRGEYARLWKMQSGGFLQE